MIEKINLLDIIFPPVCVVCGKINKEWLCESCSRRIKRLEKSQMIYCDTYYEKVLYIFKYESLIRRLMLQFKFYNKAFIGNFFAEMIINKNYELLKNYDMIISIPMHKIKKEKRGYNQTEIIGKVISKKLGIDFYPNLFEKIINTKTQSKLGAKSRKANIKNAFFLKNELIVENKKIILFDDIYTTGATTEECAKLLKYAGAKEIIVVVIAKD